MVGLRGMGTLPGSPHTQRHPLIDPLNPETDRALQNPGGNARYLTEGGSYRMT